TANVASGTVSEARAIIDSRIRELDLPSGVRFKYAGMAEVQDESFASIFSAMILAIVLVYIVMAAILESFIHPLTVMITLPLGLIGTAFGLFFTGQTINIMSLMAMVMLVGIVVNNAILLLDATQQLRAKGKKIREALLEACPQRLRPIIMANLAIAIGMIPQAMGGSGVEYRTPMAVVQIGGVLMSAVFTIFVIPVVYTMVDRFTPAGRREHREEKAALEA
ncbi:MAG TPA: efflux RND transporter permease subunit, partial [Candidatus Krumholzibacterium sp.]|nr:efflux RND transporter permease subunit [Candidatus Krumholzibacterium sp.]